MQEDLKILLEWFMANGITDLFYDEITENTFDMPKVEHINKGDLNSVVKALVKQQEEVKEFNIIRNSHTREIADKINNLEDIINNIEKIESYANFIKSASNTVVINGNTEADILIINDLPNDEDDIDGKIFSRESGELLEKMMKSIDINSDSYCLLNSFFWRLPGNRNPIKEEMNLCRPFVEKIIAILKPKLIIFMGSYSVSTIFEENKTLLSVHGKFFDYTNCYLQENIKITGVYSPNFLIKNKNKKRDAWNDLLKVKEFLNGK